MLQNLPDTGAVENCRGSTWAKIATARAARQGVPVKWYRKEPTRQGGVGSTMSHHDIHVPLQIGSRQIMYQATALDPPGVPALLGKRSMAELDVYYATRPGRFIIPGPGGLEMRFSPGTEELAMTDKGHWYLPAKPDSSRHACSLFRSC